jgi:hypothetical protein
MDSLQYILSTYALLRDISLQIPSILCALSETQSSTQDARSDEMKLDDMPDVMYERALLETDLTRRNAYVGAT